MKLYYVPPTRAGRPRWLLEELEVPYELVRIDPSQRQQKMKHLSDRPAAKRARAD